MQVLNRILEIETLSGQRKNLYSGVCETGEKKYSLLLAGYKITIQEKVEHTGKGTLVSVVLSGEKEEASADKKDGIAISSLYQIGSGGNHFRAGVPSAVYDDEIAGGKPVYRSFMEDRLTAPLALFYEQETGEAAALKKVSSARRSEPERREKGDSRYLHETDAASIGYGWDRHAFFKIRMPYEEREKSPALDHKGTPAIAFYPLQGERFVLEFSYELLTGERYASFTDAIYTAYKELAGKKEELGEDPANLPFGGREEADIRAGSVLKTYREFGEDGAGFFFHFDPKKGYFSDPSGFGSSFNTIPHETYTHILEYGFTGRQIDIALSLAKRSDSFLARSEKVIDFFVSRCVQKNGWLYSLYDLKQDRPFAAFGDDKAPKLHYMSYGKEEGNYLRTMAEPMLDLLEAWAWYKEKGIEKKGWLQAAEQFAAFLLDKQNADGSWYRAYRKDGTPVSMTEGRCVNEEERDAGDKASTIIPVMFLCRMEELRPGAGYLAAAGKAGSYVLCRDCRKELYRGGTMDNPNLVDKEAAQYVMAGMYRLYEMTGENEWLDAALKAAKQFVTWNYIWNAPVREGTILAEKGFRTKGMGAINSVWCGGVVDIYSLFHIRELYRIGKAVKEQFLCEVAGWISLSTHQILSSDYDDMGFADTGMQPEGFGICPQGQDVGMIRKGDIWGTLGWIYSAGIGGMERYMEGIYQ